MLSGMALQNLYRAEVRINVIEIKMIDSRKKSPAVLRMILKKLVDSLEHDSLIGDFDEMFTVIKKEKGTIHAVFWYMVQILRSVPVFFSYKTLRSIAMLINYLKISIRNILRHKGYSFINIFGLALGMACCVLITLWVVDELSYDKYHENADLLYRVEQDQDYSGQTFHVNVTPFPLGPALKDNIPEVADAARFTWAGEMLVRYGNSAFYDNWIYFVDPSCLQMFTYPVIKGDHRAPLDDPNSIVITEEMAEKYFPGEEPVGKILNLNNTYDLTVTAVLENIPDNSYTGFNMLIPTAFAESNQLINTNWGNNYLLTFIQLQEGADFAEASRKADALFDEQRRRGSVNLILAPYTDIHLHGYSGFGKSMGAIQYVYIFSVIAVLVLLIACINFMNLSTARSVNRAKEIGMRKVSGALKSNIVTQFFGESVLMSLIALGAAILMVALSMDVFNNLSGKNIPISVLVRGKIIGLMVLTALVTGVLSGIYPSFVLSAFKPVKVLSGQMRSGLKGVMFRKGMVLVQFTLSIFLIVGTLIVYNQLDYMRNKDIGYDKESLIYIPVKGDVGTKIKILKQEWLKDPKILGVSGSWQLPSSNSANSGGARWEGIDQDRTYLIGMNWINYDFIETMKIEMLEGRSFTKEFPADTAEGFILNEEVVKLMGVEGSPIGKFFSFQGRTGSVIGVMKNYHYVSVKHTIKPQVLLWAPTTSMRYILIRVGEGDINESLDSLESAWNKIAAEYPFDFRFLDDQIDRAYRTEGRLAELLKYFSGLAIIIASLGVFGLASFTAQQRTREIGIRKVLGASESKITGQLCGEFLILVLIANAAAWPLAWISGNKWLQDFAYRADIGFMVFVFAGSIAIITALISVGIQAAKAASANPVTSLKYE